MVNEDGFNIKILKEAKYLQITYANISNCSDELTITFKLRNHPVVAKWVERLILAQKSYTIDDPSRFIGFGDQKTQIAAVTKELNSCIDIINSHSIIINRKIESELEQDDLNFLHHIFEVYHGLLDKQTNEFFISAPKKVQNALANLNILVHKAESIIRGAKPRHVVTYFGLPKTKTLEINDYDFFTDVYEFGSIYLNYVEIGKTLEDLAYDQDQYIGDEAFKPFSFYSADFCVLFYNSDMHQVLQKRQTIIDYYNQHKDFFSQRNLDLNHPTLRPGRIPLADIDSHGHDVLQLLEYRQFVKNVRLI